MVTRGTLPFAIFGLALLLLARDARAAVPLIQHPVEDLAGVLDAASKERIAARLVAAKPTAQIAVLLVKTTAPDAIEDYSLKVAEQWRGGEKGRDNGALIVLAIDDHRSRIEVGYGLEARLTDVRCKQILDAARPKLKASDYGGAVSQIVEDALAAAGGAPAPAPPPPSSSGSSSDDLAGLLVVLLFLVVFATVPLLFIAFFAFTIYRIFSGARRRTPGYYYGQDANGTWAWLPMPDSPATTEASSFGIGGGGSDFSSSSSFSDSSFSGGGGDFGGGGASSSW